MIYIGVDPGKDGGYAVIYPYNDVFVGAIEGEDHSRFIATLQIIKKNADKYNKRVFAIVEKVGAMPKQGVASTFKFGKQAGFVEGALSSLKIPYQPVVPRKWKAEFGLNSDKAKSCEVCKRLFPNVDLRRTEKCRKDHDGMAEALLMAEYARRISGRNEG